MNLSSEITRTLAFTYRNVTMTRRNIFLIGDMLYWPFIAVLSIGFMLAYLNPGGRDTAVVLSGVSAISVLQTCHLDVSYVLLFDVWSKSLKHTHVAPVSNRHFLTGAWIMGIVRGIITFLILATLMRLFFKFDSFQAGFAPVAVFLAGTLVSGLLVGMFITVLLYTFGMRAEIATWSISSILLIVCGIYYPVSVLPPVMRALGHAIPLTYFLEQYRAAFGLECPPAAALKGFALSAVYGVLLYFLLLAAQRRARRRGTIMKMSE